MSRQPRPLGSLHPNCPQARPADVSAPFHSLPHMERALSLALDDLRLRYQPSKDEDGEWIGAPPEPVCARNLRAPVSGGDLADLREHHANDDLERLLLVTIAAAPVDWPAAVRAHPKFVVPSCAHLVKENSVTFPPLRTAH